MKQQKQSIDHYLDDEVYVTDDGIYSHKPKQLEKRKHSQQKPARSVFVNFIWLVLSLFYGGLCIVIAIIGMNDLS